MNIKGKSIFYRKELKRVIFGKGEDGIFYSRTSILDRDSLQVTIVGTRITEQTLKFWFHTYTQLWMENNTLSLE